MVFTSTVPNGELYAKLYSEDFCFFGFQIINPFVIQFKIYILFLISNVYLDYFPPYFFWVFTHLLHSDSKGRKC